jgi:leucine dehydrogenase
LAEGGAEVTIADIDPARHALADHLGADWIEPEQAILADCEVLAPCALGGVVDTTTVDRLRCAIVCGAANNVLTDDRLATSLASRDIVYAPDFIANAGGLINVYAELRRLDRQSVATLVDGISSAMRQILEAADRHGSTPLAEAKALALRRLRAGA